MDTVDGVWKEDLLRAGVITWNWVPEVPGAAAREVDSPDQELLLQQTQEGRQEVRVEWKKMWGCAHEHPQQHIGWRWIVIRVVLIVNEIYSNIC